ncbi:MAG: cobalamin biosynthesis bifunctional protein CbiET, partial [Pirellulaceae bacterium]
PDPDAIFVGGTGRMVRTIVELALGRLRAGGRIVANVSSIDNVSAVYSFLQRETGEAEVWMMHLARGTLQMEQLRFESMNPTFLLRAIKGKKS